MRTLSILTLLMLLCSVSLFSQVAVNTDGSIPDNSAMLDVKSTTKGMLVPRMTAAERDAISNPAKGLLIFCTDNNQHYSNKGTPASPNWLMISSHWISSGNNIYFVTGNVGIGISNPQQKLQIAGNVAAEYGTVTSASYRFGDGSENTGFSSPVLNVMSLISNGVETARMDGSGRLKIGAGNAISSAQLEVSSTTGGFLPPRMTSSQISAIASPVAGLMVYNSTTNALMVYTGSTWFSLMGNSCGEINYGGQMYSTVMIGTQCWMKENLNIGTRIDGSLNQTNNAYIEKYCYNDLESNCDIYGGLYQWDEVMQYVTTEEAQGICPAGWHVPSYADWTCLISYLEINAGGKLKESGTLHWAAPNTGATNSSGFTALPGGGQIGATSSGLTEDGVFWTSTGPNPTTAVSQLLQHDNEVVIIVYDNITFGNSCRCIQD